MVVTEDVACRAVAQIVARVAGRGGLAPEVTDATPLREGLWLDSMELLEVVVACEEHFGIAFVESHDLTPASLATVGTLARVVAARMAAGAGS